MIKIIKNGFIFIILKLKDNLILVHNIDMNQKAWVDIDSLL